MPSVTATAHANLAFVKYWGKVDFKLNLPTNGSVSMNLSAAKTTTTVSFDGRYTSDTIIVEGTELDPADTFAGKVSAHLDRVRTLAGIDTRAKVETANNFPQGAGFASSASGFAALTLAATRAADLDDMDDKALSRLARVGSGSACRSIPAGFVEWLAGMDDQTSYAVQVAPPDHWDIRDVAVVVSSEEKKVPSTEGHRLVTESPYWLTRKAHVVNRVNRVAHAIKSREFERFGRELEAEAMEMHAVALTSAHERNGDWTSGIYYIEPDTLALMRAVQDWRADGLPVYFTLDAGPTVHLICQGEHAEQVQDAVRDLQSGRDWTLYVSEPAEGAQVVED